MTLPFTCLFVFVLSVFSFFAFSFGFGLAAACTHDSVLHISQFINPFVERSKISEIRALIQLAIVLVTKNHTNTQYSHLNPI